MKTSLCVKGILTWCPCKQDGEQVDADRDGIEKWKSSEAIGDGVRLWKSVGQTRLVLPAQRHYTAKANKKRDENSLKVFNVSEILDSCLCYAESR